MKTLQGWIIKYGKPSNALALGPNGKSVTEVIAPGAFTESVTAIMAGKAQIEANIEHTHDDALMRVGITGRNVKLEDKPEGVLATINLADETVSNDIFAKAQAGIVKGLSVQYTTDVEPTYSQDANGNYIRTITKATLTGFAITAEPAYPDAQITAATESSRSLSKAEKDRIAKEIAGIESRKAKTELARHFAYLMDL